MIWQFRFQVFHLKKMKTLTRKDTYMPTFSEAFVIITKTWKQRKCPSTDGWIKKTCCIYCVYIQP